MPDHVADYSSARPSPAALKAAGYVGVMRYLSGGGSKDLTIPERDALHKVGLGIGLVRETTAARMNGGAQAGTSDALAANQQANVLGFPTDRPIIFADDQNACTPAHEAYMAAAQKASVRPVGPYGNGALVDYCVTQLGCRWAWHVDSWGKTTHATLAQMPNVPSPVPGTDMNYALKPDWGQWPYAQSAAQEDLMFRITIDGTTFYTCALGAFIRKSTADDAKHEAWKVSQAEYTKIAAACTAPVSGGAGLSEAQVKALIATTKLTP